MKRAQILEQTGVKLTRKERRELVAAAQAAARPKVEPTKSADGFPSAGRSVGAGYTTGGNLRRRAMRVSTVRYQAALPFLAEAGTGVRGPRIGLDKQGNYFHFDPWVFYQMGWITGTSIVQIGAVGSGKSTFSKTVIRRAIAQGRKAALASDPKGEWTRVAETVEGSQVLRLGAYGQRINPLDPGVRPAGMSDEQWRSETHTRRLQLLLAVISVMAEGRTIRPVEHTALDLALRSLEADGGTPTIRGLIYRLREPEESDRQDVGDGGIEISHALRRAVTGDLAGMFDEESTVAFDTDSPMLVMDTRVLLNKPAHVRAVASTCTSFWIDSVTRDPASGYWYVVNEEGWSEMRDARTIELMSERQRLAGELGLANWLILHELQDLNEAGDMGSAQRAQALGLLSKAQIKIVHRQSETSIDETAQALKLTDREATEVLNLEQGEALVKIGRHTLVGTPMITRAEFDAFNTSAMRAGV